MGRALLTTLATLLLIGATALLLRGTVGGPDLPPLRLLETLDPDALGTALRLGVWGLLGVLLLLLILRVTVVLAFLFGMGYAPLAYLGQALLLPVVRKTAGGITAGIMLSTQIAGGAAGAATTASARGSGTVLVTAATAMYGPPLANGRSGATPGPGGPGGPPLNPTKTAHSSTPSSAGTPPRSHLRTRRLLGGKARLRDGALAYTVQPGDSLSLIARRFYGDLLAYPRLFRANRGRLQPDGRRLTDPWLIEPGWTILVPLPSPVVTLQGNGELTYVVQPGDTLVTIAASLLGNWQRYTDLLALNAGHEQADGVSLRDPSLIRAGWVLRMPAEGIQAPLTHGRPARMGPPGVLRAATSRQGPHRRAVVAHSHLHRAGQSRALVPTGSPRPRRAQLPAALAPPARALRVLPPPRDRGAPRAGARQDAVSPPVPGMRPVARGIPARGWTPASPRSAMHDDGPSQRLIKPRPTPRTAPIVRLPDGRLLPTSLVATFLALLAMAAWRRRRVGNPAPLAVVAGAWQGVTGGLATALAGRLRGDELNRIAPVLRALDAALCERGLDRPSVRWVREGEDQLTIALTTAPGTEEDVLASEGGLVARLGCPVHARADNLGVVLNLQQVPAALWAAASEGVTPDPAVGAGSTPHPVPLLLGLGASADGQALHANLEATGPLLVASSAAGGSGTLLLTLLVHLAAQTRPTQVILLVAAGPGSPLCALAPLPHLAASLADPADHAAVAGLLDLAEEALEERRAGAQARGDAPPALVVAIDRLEELTAHQELRARLDALARDGHDAGLHLLATTEDLAALADVGALSSFTGRLALRLPGEEESRLAVGAASAETLGQGEALWQREDGTPERLHAFALAASEAREIVAAITAAAPPRPEPNGSGGSEDNEQETTPVDAADPGVDAGAINPVPAPQPALPLVTVRLLCDGIIGVFMAGAPLSLKNNEGLARQPRELLAYLALQRGHPAPRDRVMEALWPDKEPRKSINCFHQAVRLLRSGLARQQGMPAGDDIILENRGEYSLAPDLFWMDFLAFEAVLDEATAAERAEEGERQGELLRQAIDLYGGDLLGDQVADWAAGERNRLQERYLTALRALSRWHEARGNLADALTLAIRLAEVDPLAETYHRRVMRLQAKSGDTEAVRRRYTLLCEILQREVGAGPGERTQGLYRRAMQQKGGEQEERLPGDVA